jgi:20S proteasome subunit beta 3
MELNGGSVVAMVGKNCVAIASDLRLGNQALTVATNFEKVCCLTCVSLVPGPYYIIP